MLLKSFQLKTHFVLSLRRFNTWQWNEEPKGQDRNCCHDTNPKKNPFGKINPSQRFLAVKI